MWLVDGTLIGATTLHQIGHGHNDNECILHTSQISRTGASPSHAA